VPEPRQLSRPELRKIAIYQKAILICIKLEIVAVICPFKMPAHLRLVPGITFMAVNVVASASVFLLATRLAGTKWGIIQGIVTLVPIFGFLMLYEINQRATATLRDYGIRVGLLGARLSDLKI
jgi:hypothetical protein